MDTSTAQWPQGIGLVKPIVMDHHNQDEEIRNGNACNRAINNGGERRATRPQEQLNCPRCNSTNTKFCYYNNYSLTQPRYFCKGCRRYWTEGGSLRNVPVGGGSRKNKRSSSSTYKLPDLNPHDQNPNNKLSQAGHDLNLSFQGSFMQLPKMENHQNESNNNNPCSNSSSSSALDLLRTGIAGSFIDSNTSIYSSSSAPAGGFSLQSTHHQLMSFPVMDALASNGNNTGRLFFPFGDFNKQVTTPVAAGAVHQDNKGNNNNANRYWNGMLQQGGGGGSSW